MNYLTNMKTFHYKILIAGISVVGIFLRLYRLGFESLWYDEVCSYDFARMPLMDILLGRNGMDTPPLYILLLRVWMKLGPDTDWWIRLLSAALGCISLWPAYFFGKRIFGKSTALLIYYLLFALSGILIYFSQEARMYALMVVLVLGANMLCLSLVRTGRRRFAVLLAMITGLILYTHTVAVLYVISLNAILVLWVFQNRYSALKRGKTYALYALLLVPCAVPAIVFLNNQARSISWLEIANRDRSLAGLAWAAFSRFVIETGAPLNQHLLRSLSAILLVLAAAGIISPLLRGFKKSADTKNFVDIVAWLLVLVTTLLPCLMLIGISLIKPLFLDRYLLYGVPSLLAAVAAGVAWLPGRRLREILVVVFALVFLGNALLLAHTRQKNDCRLASMETLHEYKPGHIVAFFPGYNVRWFQYYTRGHSIPVLALPSDVGPQFEKAVSDLDQLQNKYSVLWMFYSFPSVAGKWQDLARHLDQTHRRILVRQYGNNFFLVGYDLQTRLPAN